MSREELVPTLIAVVEEMKANGMPWWSSEETVRIAIRRWNSFDRRHKKTKRITFQMRVVDLAKGLQSHFEPDIRYTDPPSYMYVAEPLAEVLDSHWGMT